MSNVGPFSVQSFLPRPIRCLADSSNAKVVCPLPGDRLAPAYRYIDPRIDHCAPCPNEPRIGAAGCRMTPGTLTLSSRLDPTLSPLFRPKMR